MEKFDPTNPYVATITGKKVHLLNPTVDEFVIEDIAHALSQICRYTGHTMEFYSVAQHCIHVANCVPHEFKLWGLLHDATEAYLGDVNSPLKALLPNYKDIEHNMMSVIAQKFGLSGEIPSIVKEFDTRMLFNEVHILLPRVDIAEWSLPFGPVENLLIEPLSPRLAYAFYLDMFYWGCK